MVDTLEEEAMEIKRTVVQCFIAEIRTLSLVMCFSGYW